MTKLFIASIIALAIAGDPAAGDWAPATLEYPPKAKSEPGVPPVSLGRKVATGADLTRHVAESHTSAIVLRPFSSLRNLVSLTFNATTGFVRDIALDAVMFRRLERKPVPPLAGRPGMNLRQWEQDLDRITGTRRTRGKLDLLVDGQAFFDRLIAEIADSRESITFRTYIFDNDDYALMIADMLKRRSEDIPVDIFVDGLGTLGGSLITSDSLPRDFVTPVSIESYVERGSNIDFTKHHNTWFMGDHTKTFIFDRETAFLGGMNIGREYRYDWHDLMVELSGPIVDQLNHDTEKSAAQSQLGDFAFLKRVKREQVNESAPGDAELRLLYTKPMNAQIYRAQLAAIRRSRNHIFIQNAYLADDLLLYELARARRRGVDVRVVIPTRPDNEMMNRSNVLAVNLLKRHGVRVYRYPGMSHVKAAIYDDWACFGTANFDKLSFKVNKEVNIATSDPEIVAELKQKLFYIDFAISQEVTDAQPVFVADHIYEKIVDVML